MSGPDFTENDLRAIERVRDLPPDEPPDWMRGEVIYSEARLFLQDAMAALQGEDLDPEEALNCARHAIMRIEATL